MQHEGTPLHDAAYNGHPAVCDLLLKSGAEVHSKDQASIKYFATRLRFRIPIFTYLLQLTCGTNLRLIASSYFPSNYSI